MPTQLEDVSISEISLVDKGANPGAKAVLVKRDFSQEQRDAMASKGTAMPDGSYPIANVADLKNAIQAYGRAKDKAATKAHIIRRARVLGAADQLPKEWMTKNDDAKGILRRIGEMLGVTAYGEEKGEGGEDEGEPIDPADADMQGLSFNTAYAAIEAREYAADIMGEVEEACEALYRSVHSILDDETVTDPEAAVKATVDQFKTHMAGLVPEAMEKVKADIAKALKAGSASTPETVEKGIDPMTEDVTKALADKDAEIARLTEIVKGAYSTDEVDHMEKMDAEAKAKFRTMSPEDRKAEMDKCNTMTKRDELPDDIRKALGEAEDLKKRLASLEAKNEREAFAKRAASAGLTDEWADHLHAISKMDPRVADAVEKLAKTALEIEKKSPLFKEIGSSNGPDATSAEEMLKAKQREISSRDKITLEKALVVACHEHPDLYRQYVAERA